MLCKEHMLGIPQKTTIIQLEVSSNCIEKKCSNSHNNNFIQLKKYTYIGFKLLKYTFKYLNIILLKIKFTVLILDLRVFNLPLNLSIYVTIYLPT